MNLPAARLLAIELMTKHNLVPAWSFDFDRSKRRFGACHYEKKQITLSRPLTELNSEIRVRNTILHEIAHALLPGEHHSYRWHRLAVSIGCDGKRCYFESNTQAPHLSVVAVEKAFVGTCPRCGGKSYRHKNVFKPLACTSCCRLYNNGRYDVRFIRTWTATNTSAGADVALRKMSTADLQKLISGLTSSEE